MKPRLSARLLFAAIGAVACLLSALLMESVFRTAHISRWLDDHETRLLLFFFPHRSETERRLQQANAKTGDVEVILTWNNLNDLDLHCIDPTGLPDGHIFYGHKISQRSGGELDVDRNAGPPYTQQPVEHIYWPHGRAPSGRYRVYVDEYARHGGSDPTAYQVIVKEYGHSRKYTGKISYGYQRQADEPGKFICEFTPSRSSFVFAGLPAGFWRALAWIGFWTAVLAGLLSAALLLGLHVFYRQVYKRRFLTPGKAGGILAGSAAWGFMAGVFGQALYSLLPEVLLSKHPTYSHLAGLTLLGAILGAGLGGRIPHLPNFPALFAALLVSFPASYLFLLVVHAGSQSWARALTAALFGLAIGFMIALIVEPPEEPVEFEDDSLDSMRPLALRANRIGPTGKLRRSSKETAAR